MSKRDDHDDSRDRAKVQIRTINTLKRQCLTFKRPIAAIMILPHKCAVRPLLLVPDVPLSPHRHTFLEGKSNQFYASLIPTFGHLPNGDTLRLAHSVGKQTRADFPVKREPGWYHHGSNGCCPPRTRYCTRLRDAHTRGDIYGYSFVAGSVK